MRNLLRWSFIACTVGGLGISLVGLLSFCMWQGDMITPFRVQLLLASLISLALSFWLKDRRVLLLACAVAVVNFIPMVVRSFEFRRLPADSATGHRLSVVSTNVECDNRQYDRVLAMAAREHPDVLVAVETSPAWIKALKPLQKTYPYTLTPAIGIFGISAYAKQPFTAQIERIGRTQMPLAELHFKDYTLFIVHPMPPATQRLSGDNRLYLDTLARHLEITPGRIVVAGDFNATPWSHNLGPLIAQSIQWSKGSGLAYTWPTDRPEMAIQIDHVFTRGALAGSYRVLAPVGSDHFPVRADLVF